MISAIFGWVLLVPVAWLMAARSPLEAAVAAALIGGGAAASTVLSPPLRALILPSAIPTALSWGAGTGLVAATVPKPWLIVAFPLAMVVASLPLRVLGAPRFVNNPLARTQERWLTVVHTARFGGDLLTTAILATGATSVALAISGYLPSAGLGALFVAVALMLGHVSLRRAERLADLGPTLRVAAVVVDGSPPPDGVYSGLWPTQSKEYRDVEGTLARYRPHIARAVRERASIVVLPEVCVYLEGDAVTQWRESIERLAREFGVAIVAPYFDANTPKNALLVVDPSGVVGTFNKQHPARGLEPPCAEKTPVGPYALSNAGAISTAICVDLDYPDIAKSARNAGRPLAAPSNDWFGGFEEQHHRSAVWTAVIAGVPIVRATGHGISSIYDSAGRVVAQQSSATGPVVLVADVNA